MAGVYHKLLDIKAESVKIGQELFHVKKITQNEVMENPKRVIEEVAFMKDDMRI